tara:strand:+ start:426 stop:641 length:216 start_codon:yes stop_codon:yes gene_type:complete
MLGDYLLGLGFLLNTRSLGRLRSTGMHATIGGISKSTITTGGTLTSDTLTGLLAATAEKSNFLAKLIDFGK